MSSAIVVVVGPSGRGYAQRRSLAALEGPESGGQRRYDVAASNLLRGRQNVADSRLSEADTHQSWKGHQDMPGGVGLFATQGSPGGLAFSPQK